MMNSREQMAAIYGEPARYSEYQIGDSIVYKIGHETRRGTVIYVAAPQQLFSQHIPVCYTVDSDMGIPDPVYESDIIEGF